MNLKPIRLRFTGSFFNTLVEEQPGALSFVCYGCDKRKRSKRYAVGTDPTGASVRVCLRCTRLYNDWIVKSMIDRIIVPGLVREFLDSTRSVRSEGD
jgi:hypothetical protein